MESLVHAFFDRDGGFPLVESRCYASSFQFPLLGFRFIVVKYATHFYRLSNSSRKRLQPFGSRSSQEKNKEFYLYAGL